MCDNCKNNEKPAKHGKRWDDDDQLTLLVEFAKGTQIADIAIVLGRTEVAVLGRLAEFDLVEFRRDEQAYYTVPTCLYAF